MNPVLFCIFAFLLITAALGVIVIPNPVRGALCLVTTLFLLAVMFLFLNASLVAALQVVVYAGAIMVLFLFVIMLLNLQEEPQTLARLGMRVAAAFAASLFVLAALRFFAVPVPSKPGIGMRGALPPSFGSTELLAERLFTQYLLAFEITSVLLLVAIVGAVVLAKRKLV